MSSRDSDEALQKKHRDAEMVLVCCRGYNAVIDSSEVTERLNGIEWLLNDIKLDRRILETLEAAA